MKVWLKLVSERNFVYAANRILAKECMELMERLEDVFIQSQRDGVPGTDSLLFRVIRLWESAKHLFEPLQVIFRPFKRKFELERLCASIVSLIDELQPASCPVNLDTGEMQEEGRRRGCVRRFLELGFDIESLVEKWVLFTKRIGSDSSDNKGCRLEYASLRLRNQSRIRGGVPNLDLSTKQVAKSLGADW